MKYLKTYLKYYKYKVGDYILVNLGDIDIVTRKEINLPIDGNEQPAIITKILHKVNHEYIFICKFKTEKTERINISEIIRKLTPEEIENFKIKKNVNKYNL